MKVTYAPGAYMPERMSTRPLGAELESQRALHAAYGIDWPPEPKAIVANRRDRRRARSSR